jgi:hypothetical protein
MVAIYDSSGTFVEIFHSPDNSYILSTCIRHSLRLFLIKAINVQCSQKESSWLTVPTT